MADKCRVIVIAAHPDDEVLGCGGTIARHCAHGDEVHIVIMAEGLTSRDKARDISIRADNLAALEECAREAGKKLGVASVSMEQFPDNRMDSVDLLDIVKTVERHLADVSPRIVYTHHGGDLNIDHRIVHDAVVTACRPYPEQTVNSLLFFEVPSSTEWAISGRSDPFSPNWFVDIIDTLDKKLEVCSAYRSEMRQWPHPRSLQGVENLARQRGVSVGLEAAEAFVLGRQINLRK